jgi:hypothetical protein
MRFSVRSAVEDDRCGERALAQRVETAVELDER